MRHTVTVNGMAWKVLRSGHARMVGVWKGGVEGRRGARWMGQLLAKSHNDLFGVVAEYMMARGLLIWQILCVSIDHMLILCLLGCVGMDTGR